MSFGDLTGLIAPQDPNVSQYVDPNLQAQARNAAMIRLGLGIMSAPYSMRGTAAGIGGAVADASNDYNAAMDNAFRHTMTAREIQNNQEDRDYLHKQRELALEAATRTQQEGAAQTAQRVLTGLNGAQDPNAYLSLVQNSPEFKQALTTLGIQAPYSGPMASPDNLDQFRQQLQAAAGVSAPAAAPIKLSQGDVLLDPLTKQPIASAAPKLNIEHVDLGDRVRLVNNQTGETIGEVKKGMPPAAMGDPNSVEETAQMIANGQIPMISGFALKTPWGQSVIARVGQINPNYSAANYQAGQQTLTAFSKGKQGDTVRSLNVAVQHLDTLGQLSDNLDNTSSPAFNKVANIWKTQTGQTAPNTFDAAKKIVADEVVKAVVGAGGGVADREEAAKTVSAANSPEQLKRVISTYQQLMSGQLGGLRQQYEQGTGRQDFDRFIAPRTKEVLESHAAGGGNTAAKTMPTGAKLLVYTNAHPEFGGDQTKAMAFLKSQGYQ